MVFYTAFNSISVISRRQLTLFMSSWVSPVLGWGSEVSCPRTLPRKNPVDPVWLEPRTPALRVKHFTTEQRRTPQYERPILRLINCLHGILPFTPLILILTHYQTTNYRQFQTERVCRRQFQI